MPRRNLHQTSVVQRQWDVSGASLEEENNLPRANGNLLGVVDVSAAGSFVAPSKTVEEHAVPVGSPLQFASVDGTHPVNAPIDRAAARGALLVIF